MLTFRELNCCTSHYCPAARPSRPCPSSLVYLDSAPPHEENCKDQKNGLLPRRINQIFKMKNISFGSSYVKKEGAGGEESRFSSVHLFYTMMVFYYQPMSFSQKRQRGGFSPSAFIWKDNPQLSFIKYNLGQWEQTHMVTETEFQSREFQQNSTKPPRSPLICNIC